MALLSWRVVHDGKTPPPGAVVRADERLSWPRTVGLGAQHVVAMFGATLVFPIVMGLNPQLAIMMSGIATICFLLIVQNKVPSYLGTIVTIAAFHLVRLLAPPHLREDQRLEGTGRPRGGGEGAAIIIDEPGAYKEP